MRYLGPPHDPHPAHGADVSEPCQACEDSCVGVCLEHHMAQTGRVLVKDIIFRCDNTKCATIKVKRGDGRAATLDVFGVCRKCCAGSMRRIP